MCGGGGGGNGPALDHRSPFSTRSTGWRWSSCWRWSVVVCCQHDVLTSCCKVLLHILSSDTIIHVVVSALTLVPLVLSFAMAAPAGLRRGDALTTADHVLLSVADRLVDSRCVYVVCVCGVCM